MAGIARLRPDLPTSPDRGTEFTIQESGILSGLPIKRPGVDKSSRALPQRGQEIAFALLARRDYSQEEMGRKLAARGISREEIEGILQTLQDRELLDDRRYAQRWALFWIQGKLLGPLRIKMKLLQKGIPESIVKEVLVSTEEILPAKERLRKILAAQWKKQENVPFTPQRKKKLMNFLRQKGYGWEDISETLQESGGFAEE